MSHAAYTILDSNQNLRLLLMQYRKQREQFPDAEWHDRVMELGGVNVTELSRLHGVLLAQGWLDINVSREAFSVPGRLAHCYKVTREGLQALRMADNPFLAAEEESDPDPVNEPADLATEQG